MMAPGRELVVLLSYLLALLCPQLAASMGMGLPSTPKAAANRADIPFIKCQVCEAMVKQAKTAVKDLRAAVKPGKPLSEGDIMDVLESMCNTEHNAGDWIMRFDLQEEGSALKLVDMGKAGQCGAECATIAKACEQVLDKLDVSDLSEMLYKGEQRAALNQWACYDESRACLTKPPPLPKDREPGPAFAPMDETKLQHQQIMRNMKAAGLKGTMFDRDSIQGQMADLMKEGDGDDDEDAGSEAAAAGSVPLAGGEL